METEKESEREKETVQGKEKHTKTMTELDITGTDTESVIHIEKCQWWTEREHLLSCEHDSRVKRDSVCVS